MVDSKRKITGPSAGEVIRSKDCSWNVVKVFITAYNIEIVNSVNKFKIRH